MSCIGSSKSINISQSWCSNCNLEQLSNLSLTFSTISEMMLLTILILFRQGTANGMISQLSISYEKHITRKINMEDLKFCGSSAKKSETTKFDYSFDCQRSFKVCVGHFSMILYLKAFQKNIKNATFHLKFLYLTYFSWWPLCQRNISNNPKLHDIMRWHNVTKKYLWLKFVDEKIFR